MANITINIDDNNADRIIQAIEGMSGQKLKIESNKTNQIIKFEVSNRIKYENKLSFGKRFICDFIKVIVKSYEEKIQEENIKNQIETIENSKEEIIIEEDLLT